MPHFLFWQCINQVKHLGLCSIDQPPIHIRFHKSRAATAGEEVRQQQPAAGLVSRNKREFEPARQRFEEALGICTRLGEHLYARHIEQLLGQGNTSEHRITLASSQQLDARGAGERETASRSPRPSETSSRHISIDSPPGQASGPGRRG